MAKLSTDELLDAFKEMTLLELSEFVKQFEETFGVTAAAPVAPRSPPVRSIGATGSTGDAAPGSVGCGMEPLIPSPRCAAAG